MDRSRYLLIPLMFPIAQAFADHSEAFSTRQLPIDSPARIVTDSDGIPHISARSETDMAFLQGYVHARDRLFQMDVSRRRADGTLAELLGPGPNNTTLAGDVMLRTIGLSRAPDRPLPVASHQMRNPLPP